MRDTLVCFFTVSHIFCKIFFYRRNASYCNVLPGYTVLNSTGNPAKRAPVDLDWSTLFLILVLKSIYYILYGCQVRGRDLSRPEESRECEWWVIPQSPHLPPFPFLPSLPCPGFSAFHFNLMCLCVLVCVHFSRIDASTAANRRREKWASAYERDPMQSF